jgi:hypothetical protein
MNFKEGAIRRTTESIDIQVRSFVLDNKIGKESFNETIRRLLKMPEV